jgi:hypothetical protein
MTVPPAGFPIGHLGLLETENREQTPHLTSKLLILMTCINYGSTHASDRAEYLKGGLKQKLKSRRLAYILIF